MPSPVTYTNARIFDGRRLLAERCFTVSDGRFEAIGPHAAGGPVRDLKNRLVIPGLVDIHMHTEEMAMAEDQIVVLPPAVQSIADIQDLIAERRRAIAPGAWIIGWGYDEGKLKERRAPHRRDLDQVSPDNPVFLSRACGHVGAVNSVVLGALGIDRNTPDPSGGVIDRDGDGEPSGVLREKATEPVYRLMPNQSPAEVAARLVRLAPRLLAHGITAISELTANYRPDEPEQDSAATFGAARRAGFPLPVTLFYVWGQIKRSAKKSRPAGPFEDGVMLGGIKMFADGSITGRTAWVAPPFEPHDQRAGDGGLALLTPAELLEAADLARLWGVQLAVHAIGNCAIEQVVSTLASVSPWLTDRPSIRVEHGALVNQSVLERASRAGIAFVMQPIFLYAEIESFVAHLGDARTAAQYPVRSALEAGAAVCLSSDAPATAWADPANPWLGLYTATTRKSHDGRTFGAGQRIDLHTALGLYTAKAARIGGFESGTIEAGAPADFVVLDTDIFENPDALRNVKVLAAAVRGSVLHGKI
jgi:predicted amidohydrolase YtcJ